MFFAGQRPRDFVSTALHTVKHLQEGQVEGTMSQKGRDIRWLSTSEVIREGEIYSCYKVQKVMKKGWEFKVWEIERMNRKKNKSLVSSGSRDNY